MKKLYVFNFAEYTQNTKLLASILSLAGHNVCLLSDISGTGQFETDIEKGEEKPLVAGIPTNPKEILFVECDRLPKISKRFSTRVIDYPEVLQGLSHLTWTMRFVAEKIIAKLMGLELPMIYQILTGESEGE